MIRSYPNNFPSIQPRLLLVDDDETLISLCSNYFRNEGYDIVRKVNQLMSFCDDLETQLSQSHSNCDELLTAIVSNNESVSVKKKDNLIMFY